MDSMKKFMKISTFVYLILTLSIGVTMTWIKYLPWYYNLLTGLVMTMFIGLAFINRNRWLKVLVVLLVLIINTGLVTVQIQLNRVVEQEPVETSSLTFLVMADSPFVTWSAINEYTIAISSIMDDTLVEGIKAELDSRNVTAQYVMTPSDEASYEALKKGDVDLMVMDVELLEALGELDPDFAIMTRRVYTFDKTYIQSVAMEDVDVSQESFIVFISGIDTSGPISKRSRSDVNILAVINPISHQILLVHIARDTYLPLGCQTGANDKLTHAGLYGVSCSIKTIEQFMGITVNYYLKVNFTSFIDIVDVLGTISVYSTQTFNTTYFGPKRPSYSIQAGLNEMDAAMALAFARERMALESGDVARGRHQTEIIKGIMKKLLSVDSLSKLDPILTVIHNSADTNFPAERLNALIQLQFEKTPSWSVQSYTLSYTSDMLPTYSFGPRPLFVVHPSEASVVEALERIQAIMNHD